MSEPMLSRCVTCRHFQDFAPNTSEPGQVDSFDALCEAYPQGIPPTVYAWVEPHTTVREDQTGEFVFDEDAALVAANPGIPDVLDLEE